MAFKKGHIGWMKNKKHPDETKRKISESLKKAYKEGKHIYSTKGKHLSEETRKKMSFSRSKEKHPLWGKHHSEESKQKMRLKKLGLYAGKLYLDSILQNHFPDEWKFVGDGQVIIGGLCPDFINVNGKKKIIELFGHFWHEGKIISKGGVLEHRTEAGKKKVYGEIGYDTLVIWDDELDNESKVIEKINRFLFDTR
jgi:hypothetical protein